MKRKLNQHEHNRKQKLKTKNENRNLEQSATLKENTKTREHMHQPRTMLTLSYTKACFQTKTEEFMNDKNNNHHDY